MLQRGHPPIIWWRVGPPRFPPEVRSGSRSNRMWRRVQGQSPRSFVKGPAQHWYSNLPNGHIRAWDQLRAELSAVFWAAKPDKVNSCDFHNLEQGGSTLQEYLHCLVRLRARAPDVAEKTIINAAVAGLSLGPTKSTSNAASRRPSTSFCR